MATSTIAGRVHELGVKLEPPPEIEINVSENVNSSVENGNDNGRRCLLKCLAGAAAASAGCSTAAADGHSGGSSTPGSPLLKLSVAGESCHELKSKTDKIREAVEQVTSEESKKKITRLLAEVQQLPDVEKLLLYLRLPSGPKVEVDPLKQSFVSSLGNRYEVTQTVTWIQTHLEEDSEVSLPKQEVYDGYCEHCARVEMKPLSTADFGKVMKQVFPNVRPRRLGTRGNSRYCYAGLRKKVILETPRLPDLSLTHEEPLEEADCDDQELNGAISFLIREWAEKVLERKFNSLKELAYHVVEKGYVTGHSVASFTMLSCAAPAGQNGKGGHQQYPVLNQCDGSKHRETRIQLQRKLHERESIREQKKRLVEQRNQGDKSSHSASAFATTSSLSISKLSNRKNQNSKSAQPDTLRQLLSNSAGENGTDSKKRSGDGCCSSYDNGVAMLTPKVEKNGSVESACGEKISCDAAIKLSPLPKRRGSSLAKSAGEHQTEPSVPIRRRSGGGGGDNKSPRPSPLVSGWGTPTPSSADVAGGMTACHKSGKVMIPRVTTRSNSNGGNSVSCSAGNGNAPGSKLCFPSANIIIIPPISTGVSIPTEFNSGRGGGTPVSTAASASSSTGSNGVGGQKSKYKLIQPKPCTLNSLNEVKNVTESAKESVGDKEPERVTKTSRRGSGSNVKRCVEEKDDLETGKVSKCRKRNRQPSEGEKSKGKRLCTQAQQQKLVVEETKIAPKCAEEDTNEGPQGEMNISTLEQDALLDYLNDSTPSVEQEDELVRYFGNGDDDNNVPGNVEIKSENCDMDFGNEQAVELSQLRQLLLRNIKSKFPSEYQNMDGQEAMLQREISGLTWPPSTAANYKDNTPTLRLLLAEERHGSGSDIQNVSTGNDQSVMEEGNLNVNSGSLNGAMQMVDSSVSSTQLESWRQGGPGELYAARNSDEILMSSDSSSGCYPPLSGGSFMSIDEGIFERGSDHLNQQQLMESCSGSQFNPGVTYSGHMLSYPQHGNGHSNSSVPPSPNTRRRAFNFQPISPQSTPVQEAHSRTQSPLPYQTSGGPMLSTVRSSYGAGPASATSSPFVSPRSTPSSLCRSRHNSGQALNTASSSSAIGTPRATPHPHHVATDQSSCLPSPFISPHPTPVPFSRSRHNSSQQQRFGNNNNSVSCTPTSGRSRHPSELMLGQMLSPGGSAPMSPLEVQQSHSSITHYCDTAAAVENPFNNNRSRHNSSSGYGSLALPPPPPPLPPLTLLNVSPPNPSPLGPPPPPLPLKTASDVENAIHNWSVNDGQGIDWPIRQIDPRLLSRQRHASVGSHFGQHHSNIGCPPPAISSSTASSSSLHGLNQTSMLEQASQEVAQQLMLKVEQSDMQGAVNRSRSVPIYQMLQNMIQQVEPSDEPIRDVMMSHSYPATPTGQSTTFNFGVSRFGGGGGVTEGNELDLDLGQSMEDADDVEELVEVERHMKNQPYQRQREESGVVENVNDGNNLSATLDLPMDQYQNIIPPCPLDDFMLQEFPPVEFPPGDLEQCFAVATASSTQQ